MFHPSLEDTIRDLFNQTTSDLDAFHQDPQWAAVAKKPVMKGAISFFGLITALCKMLDTIPPDQAFGQLTIDLLKSYYDKCFDWYKGLYLVVYGCLREWITNFTNRTCFKTPSCFWECRWSCVRDQEKCRVGKA